MDNKDQHMTLSGIHTLDISQYYPEYYFPTQFFTEGLTPMLYFNVTMPVVNPQTIRHYKLSGPMKEEETFPDHLARITIHCISNCLCMNLIAHYIQTRLELFEMHYSIASDGMTYLDINAILTDPIEDPRQSLHFLFIYLYICLKLFY